MIAVSHDLHRNFRAKIAGWLDIAYGAQQHDFRLVECLLNLAHVGRRSAAIGHADWLPLGNPYGLPRAPGTRLARARIARGRIG